VSNHRDFVEGLLVEPMNVAANLLNGGLPEGYGFALLVFGLGEAEGYMNYISNANREDMICALKELVANFEGRTQDPPRSKQ